MQDITDFLAFEIKKEMADRYFGFRKQIEEDTQAYRDRIARSYLDLETDIMFSILRLYMLLNEEKLISSFLSLTGLPGDFFLDSYILSSPSIRQRVFAGAATRGITRKKRFTNLFLDSYKNLAAGIERYRQTLEELTQEQEAISEDIESFYKNNDIDIIMSFIRRIDSPDAAASNIMLTGRSEKADGRLADQLRLHPPRPASELLPRLPSIPALREVKPQLLQLAKHAYDANPDLDLNSLCSRRS